MAASVISSASGFVHAASTKEVLACHGCLSNFQLLVEILTERVWGFSSS